MIKNIIFDFGDIFINLDKKATHKELEKLGVSNISDIKALCNVANIGIRGVITGTAIYEGTLDFKAAQQLAKELTG